ncbi:ferredoxin [Pseudarthrobacter sp. PvP004]|uniref:ferredoxin n=1 Tax=Pseudarthrobacter sp. PvP004 TaxID=2817850 RepID=UPI001AE38F58|nr:ferredoxin [Pseudarthrobacter sp. PvP004]MBP2266368.1 ferredoxin [Pseudarthrobacter sp. PvP004]
MKIDVDIDKCVGAGVCVLAAPDVFDQNDDDGIVIVLEDQPTAAQIPDVQDAAARCPAAVIRLTEGP